MRSEIPPIYFYLPKKDWRSDFPDTANVYWPEFGRGIYSWTLQTYLYLKGCNFPCQLTDTIPDQGIMLAHRDSLKYEFRPTSNLFIVCLKSDREFHGYSQSHIVQNPQETKEVKNSIFMPHWPQPGLVPRNPQRGNRVENVAFFGLSFNLSQELKDPNWKKQLEELGFNWQIQPRDRWYDYSDVDAVVAVRNFQHNQTYDWKPATKLYNAWLAGVPALLGYESAFRAERQTALDYIEVQSPQAILTALQQLKQDPELYQNIITNGQRRAVVTSPEKLTQRWSDLLEKDIAEAYQQWCQSSAWHKQLYVGQCYAKIKLQALQRRINAWRKITKQGPTHPRQQAVNSSFSE